MKASPAIVAFNAGELSPRLDGRTDLDKYAKGCRTLENFLPLVQGGALKRSGTRFAGRLRDADAPFRRLVPFVFNRSDAYVIALGQSVGIGSTYVFRSNAPVFDLTATITGATQANPVVVTAPAHGLSNSQIIYINGVGGMTELNGRTFMTSAVTANTFALLGDGGFVNVDGTGYGAYTSGGTVSRYLSFSHPYIAAELDTLQWAGQNDVMYFACPTKPPYKLSRVSATDWTFTQVDFKDFPFSPENTDDDSFVAASGGGVGSSITLTASDAIFSSSVVNSYFKLREIPEAYNPEWKAKTNLDGNEYDAFKVNGVTFEVGDCVQYQGRVYECARNAGATATTGTVAPVHDRGYASDGSDTDWKFKNYGYGYAKITAFTDAHRVTAQIIVDMPKSCISADQSVSSMSTANPIVVTMGAAHGWETGDRVFFRTITGTFGTLVNNTLQTITKTGATTFTIPLNGAGKAGGVGSAIRLDPAARTGSGGKIYPNLTRWSFGAWGADRGYPRAVLFYQDRLIWGGTDSNPQTMWASEVGRYESHRIFDEDDAAWVGTLSSSDPLEWLLDQSALVAGTAGDEYANNRNATDPLTASNLNTITLRSRYGSRRAVRPVGVENVILFAQAAGRKLRELVFDDTVDGFTATDMTRLSDHITLGLIKDMAFQSEPNRILWVVLEDGQLLGFTYERDEQVTGWHRHPIGGTNAKVISVAVIPHPDGDADQLWLIVERTIDGVTRRHVEYLEKEWTRDMAIEDGLFVDSGFTYDSSPATVISGLWNLRGETVSVLADGTYVGDQVVTSAGKITLAAATSVVQVGLPYSAKLAPMRLEAGAADGTAQGKTKRIQTVVLRLDQTGRGLYLGDTPGNATQEVRLTDGVLTDGDTELIPFPGRHDFGGLIALVHNKPTPCTITAIYPQLSTSDR